MDEIKRSGICEEYPDHGRSVSAALRGRIPRAHDDPDEFYTGGLEVQIDAIAYRGAQR